MNRGYMLVFCGLDKSGKSLMIKKLEDRRSFSERYKILRHPPDEWFENPKIIATYLDGQGDKITPEEEVEYVINLRMKVQNEIIKALYNKENIIFHRYIFSLSAFYAGTEELKKEWIEKQYGDLIVPDAVIYLRIGVDEFYKRQDSKELLGFQRDRQLIKRMIDCYDDYAVRYKWHVIDAEKDDINSKVNACEDIINNININGGLNTFSGKQIIHKALI